ncbi:hypothetical protein H0H93_015833, partial [Arthromyces matolae]
MPSWIGKVQMPPTIIPKGRKLDLWIPSNDAGLDSVVNIVGLMRTAVESTKESPKAFSAWIIALKGTQYLGGKEIPKGTTSNMINHRSNRLKGNDLERRKLEIFKVVAAHNKGQWFTPVGTIKMEIERLLRHPRVPSGSGARKSSEHIQSEEEDEGVDERRNKVAIPNQFIPPRKKKLDLWIPEENQ